jgi:hypothetical protein
MPAFFKKALLIVLDALGSGAMVITIGMLAVLVGGFGAFVGFAFAFNFDLPDPLRHGVVALCTILMPVLVGVRLWQWWQATPNDEPPPSK